MRSPTVSPVAPDCRPRTSGSTPHAAPSARSFPGFMLRATGAASSPQGKIVRWGDDAAPVARSMNLAPHVTDGPAEGIGGRYKGLSGNVWQWVDTKIRSEEH